MSDADYIVVGSGINALVAAAMLGAKRNKVLVLERNERIGGCIRTDAVTEPGFIHDVMATTFVLFVTSPGFAALGADLRRHGLVFANSATPAGVLLPDGRHAVLAMDRARNVAAFDALAPGDGAAFAGEMDRLGGRAGLIFGLLGGAPWSLATLRLLLGEAWRRRPRALAAIIGEALAPARDHLETAYRSEVVRALFAPWVLHCGLGPESAYSAEMVRVVAFALEMAGAPIVEGGAANLLRAFEGLIAERGGAIRTGADAARITCNGRGRATGVALADGTRLTAAKGVIASVTPNQLYGRLLADQPAGAAAAADVAAYRYGKGDMQIHYALSAPPQWPDPALAKVALLHLTPGLDGDSRATNAALRALRPAVPTFCVGQPAALDPSRAPAGAAILWLQLPEAPRHLKGDAAGTIAVPADGRWTAELRERFADRVEAILRSHIANFDAIVRARVCYSPADLEAMNVNLVGGDPYGGSAELHQFFPWRPFKTTRNHRTAVPGLYHIGASTHPGPGLGGGSGFLVASRLG
jgi:phytoene dehydrogenase-like protein